MSDADPEDIRGNPGLEPELRHRNRLCWRKVVRLLTVVAQILVPISFALNFCQFRLARQDRAAAVLAGAPVFSRGDKGQIEFSIPFINSGAKPTSNLSWIIDVDSLEKKDKNVKTEQVQPAVGCSIVGPNSKVSGLDTYINDGASTYMELHRGSDDLPVRGMLSYNDYGSDRLHKEFFCYKLRVNGNLKMSFPDPFVCDDDPPCTDKECDKQSRRERIRTEWLNERIKALKSQKKDTALPECFNDLRSAGFMSILE